jgi:hypothetical protein
MTMIEGWAHTRWGGAGILNTEAVIAAAGVLLFFIVNFLNSAQRPLAVVD